MTDQAKDAKTGAKETEKLVDKSKTGGTVSDAKPPEMKKAPRTKEQKKASFNFMLGYAKRECCSVVLGVIFMCFASGGEIVVPLYIGACVDMMMNNDMDGIGRLSGYMLIVVIVSFLHGLDSCLL